MVRELVACPLRTDIPPSFSPFVLDPIVDLMFPLPALENHPAVYQLLVIQDSLEPPLEGQNGVPVEQTNNDN